MGSILGGAGDNSNTSIAGLPPELQGDATLASASDILGLQQAVDNNRNSTYFPWTKTVVNSTFLPSIKIDATRWDQLYPYRLLVIDTSKNNQIVNGSEAYNLKITVSQGTSSALVDIRSIDAQWAITLPITPQQLNIADQFAINTSATLRGVLEEHNGVKFKMITATGSMGVWPLRATADTSPQTSPGVLQSLFGGTIQAFNNLVTQVSAVINTATSGHPANKPTTTRPEKTPLQFAGVGYYNALTLQQFLEQYAEAKKDPANASWRLVFDIPKQNQSLVVTPIQFTWQQNVNKPMEVTYILQLKAWRRINLTANISVVPPSNQPISPGILQTILNTISQARTATSAATNLISAVTNDLEAPLNILRQSSLFVKGLAGVVTTAADLPYQLQTDYASSISQSLNILSTSISSVVTDPTIIAALAAVTASTTAVEGLSVTNVGNGQLGQEATQLQASNPAYNIFANPEQYFTLMDQVPVSTLNLSPAQQTAVDNAVSQYQTLSVAQLKQYRSSIQTLALQLSNSFGTGDAYYNKVYGLPPPAVITSPISLDNYAFLQNLYDVMQSYDILTASSTIDDQTTQSNLEYVANLANLSDIPFNIPNSKVIAPVPFGLTIEGIALRYLGDAQRWLEIVTLNNLTEPYIDEDGFQLPLLSNATGRQIVVSSIDNLYIGQSISLNSANQLPTSRHIIGLETLSQGVSYLITLDGLPNLSIYTIANQAYMQAYLPGTINSQQNIYISSDLTSNPSNNIIENPATTGDPLTGLSQVDLMLTEQGDIAINNYGDFRFSYGLANLIQALKIKLSTPVHSIMAHPEFGLGIVPGISIADVSAQDLYNSINDLIQQDPRFQGLNNLQVAINGPVLSINIGVMLAGKQGVFPLSFQLTL